MATIVTITTCTQFGEVQRPWGYEVRFNCTDSQGNTHGICITWPGRTTAPSQKEIDVRKAERIAQLEANLTFLANLAERLHVDFSTELLIDFWESLIEVVKIVRGNPDITYGNLTTAWEAARPDSLFNFVNYSQFLKERAFPGMTFSEFKSYVVNKQFRQIDDQ